MLAIRSIPSRRTARKAIAASAAIAGMTLFSSCSGQSAAEAITPQAPAPATTQVSEAGPPASTATAAQSSSPKSSSSKTSTSKSSTSKAPASKGDVALTLDGLRTQFAPVYVFVDVPEGEQGTATLTDTDVSAPLRNGNGGVVASLTAPEKGWGNKPHRIVVKTSSGKTAEATFTADPERGVSARPRIEGGSVALTGEGMPARSRGAVSVFDADGKLRGEVPVTADQQGHFTARVPVSWGRGPHIVEVTTAENQAVAWAQRVSQPH